jgi:hypothetical protein
MEESGLKGLETLRAAIKSTFDIKEHPYRGEGGGEAHMYYRFRKYCEN